MLETREFKSQPVIPVASIASDAGCVREANEDSGLHVRAGDLPTQIRRGTLTIVADGMGGHASGEVASQMATELISNYYFADSESSVADALREAVKRANEEIYDASVTDEKFFGMGTTVIVLTLLNGIGYVAHVGDSRLYRRRGSTITLLTTDHSQVMEMVKQGLITYEEARNHDDKNVILRAVGTQRAVDVEVSEPFDVAPEDEFLLCSDGLCDMLEDLEIGQIWADAANIFEATETLVRRAKEEGGHDNVTVAIVRIPRENELAVARQVPVTREVGAKLS